MWDAAYAQATWTPILRGELDRRGVRRFQVVWHGWRRWRFTVTGRYPLIGRALYAWTVAVGPLEIRRLAE